MIQTPVFQVQLLGDFQLIYGDTPLTSLDVPRVQSLFAYLVLHSATPQSRLLLASLLWPETAETQALMPEELREKVEGAIQANQPEIASTNLTSALELARKYNYL